MKCVWVGLLVVLVAGGCKRTTWGEDDVDHALVVVHDEASTLRHDTVGEGEHESTATFVLVDAEHRHAEDLDITLGGELLDASGEVVGTLRSESLRVPAGGQRLFALVDSENRARPEAASARIEVAGARKPDWTPPMYVQDGAVYGDQGRAVVNGRIVNTADGFGRVMVFAAFYDGDGKPMSRQWTLMCIGAEDDYPAQFVGPEGSRAGALFIGDMAYEPCTVPRAVDERAPTPAAP